MLSIMRRNGPFLTHICVWNRHSHSSSSIMVEGVEVVDIEDSRDDASVSDYTRVLLDESNVDNFSKNFFQALHSNASCHEEL